MRSVMSSSKKSWVRPVAVAVAVLAASLVSASCSNSGSPPPEVFVNATLGPTNADICNVGNPGTPFLQLGSQPLNASTLPTPIQGSSTVLIDCEVSGSGNGPFEVALEVQTPEGSVTISSPNLMNDPNTPQTVRVSFDAMDGSYGEKDCTANFSPSQSGGNSQMGAYPGRIFGTISCPDMPEANATSVCEGDATFLFEYCNE